MPPKKMKPDDEDDKPEVYACEFCGITKNNFKKLREHWRYSHLTKALEKGLIKATPKNLEKLNINEVNDLMSILTNLDDSATLSDYTTGNNPKYGNYNIPFLKLCIPSLSGYETEKQEAINSVNDILEKHKDDVFFNTIQSMYKALQEQGLDQQTIKQSIKNTIKHFLSSSPTNGFDVKVENLNEEYNNKLSIWKNALTIKTEEINSILQSSPDVFTEAHTFLSQRLENMTDVKQLENEIVYSEFYNIMTMVRRLQVHSKGHYVVFLKECLDEVKNGI